MISRPEKITATLFHLHFLLYDAVSYFCKMIFSLPAPPLVFTSKVLTFSLHLGLSACRENSLTVNLSSNSSLNMYVVKKRKHSKTFWNFRHFMARVWQSLLISSLSDLCRTLNDIFFFMEQIFLYLVFFFHEISFNFDGRFCWFHEP